MTSPQLLHLLDTLAFGFDPDSGRLVGADSVLRRPRVQDGITHLRSAVMAERQANRLPGRVEEPAGGPSDDLPALNEKEVLDLCRWLRTNDYRSEVTQLMKILVGSNTIKAKEIRALGQYGKYRGKLTRRDITRQLDNLAEVYPDLLQPTRQRLRPRKAERPSLNNKLPRRTSPSPTPDWREEPYFTEEAFDRLTDRNREDLTNRVGALGWKKNTSSLPAYMQRARESYPRSFEPWSVEEKAILIEAMCYTNRTEGLVDIFGRSAAALRDQGKRLIFRSKQELGKND